jgi:hypothetical protein
MKTAVRLLAEGTATENQLSRRDQLSSGARQLSYEDLKPQLSRISSLSFQGFQASAIKDFKLSAATLPRSSRIQERADALRRPAVLANYLPHVALGDSELHKHAAVVFDFGDLNVIRIINQSLGQSGHEIFQCHSSKTLLGLWELLGLAGSGLDEPLQRGGGFGSLGLPVRDAREVEREPTLLVGIESANALNETPVASTALVGHDHAVIGALLGTVT